MILHALTSYYAQLAKKGKIPREGWNKQKISFALEIDIEGNLLAVFPLKAPDDTGKRLIPRMMELPAPAKRSRNIASNFLWDNAAYLLGIGKGDDWEYAQQCFQCAAALHKNLLANASHCAARAVLNYFERFDVNALPQCVQEYTEEFSKGANIVFMYDGSYVHEDEELIDIWQSYYTQEEEGQKLVCLVTGQKVVPQLTHPSIKGMAGAQSSGAALVSFNAEAYESNGHEQNTNAPVGKYAAFAYTSALNYLISDRSHNRMIGDSTVLFWAEDADEVYQDLFAAFVDGRSDVINDSDLKSAMNNLSQGLPAFVEGCEVKFDNNFYILALSPNAARLSVRMFYVSSFGELTKNIAEHYERLKIIGVDNLIPLWLLLNETLLKIGGKAKGTPSPQMSGDTLRAVLTGGYYPATLYQQIQLRIRADKELNRIRAATIKAYLLKNSNNEKYKEVLSVELNENTTYQPYVLGRLFSVLEMIQERANPGLNATIKDKYFSSASATPAAIFPVLLNLSEKHLRKIDGGMRVYCERLKGNLAQMLTESLPAHMTLYDQGIFQLGYYHQRQKQFEKKD